MITFFPALLPLISQKKYNTNPASVVKELTIQHTTKKPLCQSTKWFAI